ncbi:MAG: hypothetical protein APF84_03165 [Gracilibacter sp. BRH_c7a]|nr:MAG: hypothetical protein APF84_03165 [Gracilibacter sp. BRH_c7a]
MKILSQIFKRKKENQLFEAMQIEVCASCNIRCTFCPTTHQHHHYGIDTMDLELFQKLALYFPWFKWVYLQGWGEPLLHKDIWQMVQLAKGAGVKVGFTTNGTLLNQDALDNIFRMGVDQISTSIAGATSESHGRLRVGSQLEQIGINVVNLLQQRRAKGINRPRVSISYMLTKDSIHELPEALKLALSWGVDDFYTTNLDYVFNQLADEQKVFCWDEEEQKSSSGSMEANLRQYQEYLDVAASLASKKKISFRSCKLAAKEQEASCELNPNKYVFITVRGDVTPCTYLARMENPKIFRGQSYKFPCQSFGNIQQSGLSQILEGEEYREFCLPFKKREQALTRLMSAFIDYEPSLLRIHQAEEEYSQHLEENSLPKPCQVCPKPFGV